MGRYQKKPYKKQSLNTLHNIDVYKEYLDELKSNNYDDIFKEQYTLDHEKNTYFDETIINEYLPKLIFKEPEIVTQLRKEERNGTLPIWLLSQKEEKQNHIDNDLPIFKEIPTITKKILRPITSYQETLEIARKTFQNTQVENYKSIIFTEESK